MTTPSELRAYANEYKIIIHTWSGTPRAAEAIKQAAIFETIASLIESVAALETKVDTQLAEIGNLIQVWQHPKAKNADTIIVSNSSAAQKAPWQGAATVTESSHIHKASDTPTEATA